MTNSLVAEKVAQATQILDELGIDLWLTFVRETTAGGDPVLPLIYGTDLTWQSALILTRQGDTLAIVGHFEAEAARQMGAYAEVVAYHEAFSPHLRAAIERFNPNQIAINYSTNDVLADGLSVGLYRLLQDYLKDTPYGDRFVSAEHIISALRGRKTPTEVERIRAAIDTTRQIYERTFITLTPGMSERQLANFMHAELQQRGLKAAWDATHCPAVHAGPDSPVGHISPGEFVAQRGQLIHFDFGVQQEGYCSDIQRVVYLAQEHESAPPAEVQRAFDTVVLAIQKAAAAMQPGMTGAEIDAIARQVVTDADYPEYMYATGHQLGRVVHDGGALLGPKWERYGDTPLRRLEVGHVYTIEPGVAVPGYGYIGLEEDVLITENGAVFLGEPQTELIVRH